MQKLAYAGERARELLDHEWRIGKWLGDQGRDFLSTMLGHNPDSVPPYTVMTLRGSPLSELGAPVDRATLRMLITGLLNGLEALRTGGVVHRGINLDTLRWDGGALQISDFTRAEFDGAGDTVSHGEDVYAAGLVIYHLYTGELPEDDPLRMRDRLRAQDEPLRQLLGGERTVFAQRPQDRPDARELLERWAPAGHRAPARARAYRDREREGRRNFHDLRDRQRAYQERHRGWSPPPPRRPWIIPRPQSPRTTSGTTPRSAARRGTEPLPRPASLRVATGLVLVLLVLVLALVWSFL
ncbi:serine/threonine-protein kinase [Nonomuraea africana]|uniref:Serine/threonine protein kinase n=1 Tax=Nonomuraea africana TaxID=46171 RepID=A0ABR9KG35_9ACTN|nr:hypothetical protein [Nonomuraea africana]MBE1560741.1 serine/threonine protein kinase [Nonomuraea africana]